MKIGEGCISFSKITGKQRTVLYFIQLKKPEFCMGKLCSLFAKFRLLLYNDFDFSTSVLFYSLVKQHFCAAKGLKTVQGKAIHRTRK